jgi:hypothetical protein
MESFASLAVIKTAFRPVNELADVVPARYSHVGATGNDRVAMAADFLDLSEMAAIGMIRDKSVANQRESRWAVASKTDPMLAAVRPPPP